MKRAIFVESIVQRKENKMDSWSWEKGPYRVMQTRNVGIPERITEIRIAYIGDEVDVMTGFGMPWVRVENFELVSSGSKILKDIKTEVKKMVKRTYNTKMKIVSSANEEMLLMEIEIPEELKETLQKCVVFNDQRIETTVKVHTGTNVPDDYTGIEFKRFKVMKYIYSNCTTNASSTSIRVNTNNGMDFLFNEDLISKGKCVYEIETLKQFECIAELIRENLARTIETYYKTQRYNMTATLTVEDKRN